MEIIKVFPRNFKKIVEISVKLIKKGKILVFPTDTVYGLLVDATNEKAVKKLFKIKKQSKGKPIPIFVKDMKMARELAYFNKFQEKFSREVWPGKITVVLKRKNSLPKILFGNKKTIGLRIPNHKLVNILLKKLNFPLTGTSANISSKPHSTRIKEIIDQFRERRNRPDLVLDNGNLEPSLPSTVIDLTEKSPKILRRGEISEKEILKVFNRLS